MLYEENERLYGKLMILNNWYWYFHKAVPINICNKIIKLGLSRKSKQGITYEINDSRTDSYRNIDEKPLTAKEKKILFKKRKNRVAWIDDPFIYNLLHPFIRTANKNAGWNFDWDWSEPAEFGSYAPGGFYGWHTDASASVATNPKHVGSVGKLRKISCILQLSHPKDYKGADFQFDFKAEDPDISGTKITTVHPLKDQGTIVCFPSFLWHRVTPLTKGKRYSLIVWSWGKPFK